MDGPLPAGHRPILEGIRVLDVATWLAASFATSLLGDFGAEVIKVEQPGQVDGARTFGGMEDVDEDRSAYFVGFGRNKKSVSLNVRHPRGRELFLDLVRQSDVLTEGMRAGTLERWGLGWDVLEAVNPRLILLRVSGYGQTGPMRDQPGFDRVAQAFAGLTYVTGQPDRPPVRAGMAVVDYGSGVWGAFAILLALRERDISGRGQVIDQALYESLIPMILESASRYVRFGEIRERTGNYWPGITPGDVFGTADGRWLTISGTGQASFERLMGAIGRSELAGDPRFATPKARDGNRDELHGLIREWAAERSAALVQAILGEAGVPCSPVLAVDEVMEHPHVKARANFVSLPDPVFGSVPASGVLPKLSRTPGAIRSPGPHVGEHNREVYCGLLGISESELGDLQTEGIV